MIGEMLFLVVFYIGATTTFYWILWFIDAFWIPMRHGRRTFEFVPYLIILDLLRQFHPILGFLSSIVLGLVAVFYTVLLIVSWGGDDK